jgi:MFS family permease
MSEVVSVARTLAHADARMIATGLGAFAVASENGWYLTLLGAALIGMGYGLLTVGFNSLFARHFGDRGAVMVNVLNAVFGVGAIAAPLLFARTGGDIRTTFLVFGVLAALLVPLAVGIDDRASGDPDKEADAARPRQQNFAAALLLATMLVAVGLEASLIGWGPTVLIEKGV